MDRGLPAGDVTFVLTDIEGSTALLRELGDAAYADMLYRVRRIQAEAAEAAGGHLVGVEGDSVLLAFETPGAALQAASAAQAKLFAHGVDSGADVRVRMGAHRGRNVTPVNGSYPTLAVHQAARVMSAANGGQVLVTAAVAEDTTECCRPIGLFVVRDFDDPVELFVVAGAGDRDSAVPRALQLGAASLPSFRTRFLGRARELEAIATALATGRLVTLLGPGGAGKTRLSIEAILAGRAEWAARWFVDLSGAGAATVDDTVRRTLGTVVPAGGDVAATLAALLHERTAVIVVDNCEHVLDVVAQAVDGLLAGCPSLRIMCTSREPLGLPDERVVHVGPLDLPCGDSPSDVLSSAAGQLFCDRAVQVSDLQLDGDSAPQVRALVADLDGLPLSLELVAAMSWAYSLADLRQVVRDQLSTPTDAVPAMRGRPSRHATLSAVIDWSVHQLKPDAVDALVALAFAAPPIAVRTALASVRAVGAPADRAAEMLEHLAKRSLIEPAEPEGAWRMLESIRIYCRGHERAAFVRPAVVAALAADCIAAVPEERTLADENPPDLSSVAPTAVSLLDGMELEPGLHQTLTVRMAPWFHELGQRSLLERCEAALRLGVHDPHVSLLLHCYAAMALSAAGDADGAQSHLDAARAHLPEDRGHSDWTRYVRGVAGVAMRRNDVAAARALIEECLPFADDVDRATLLGRLAMFKSLDNDWIGMARDFQEIMRTSPSPLTQLNLANGYAWSGQVGPALTNILELTSAETQRFRLSLVAHVTSIALTRDRRWTVKPCSLMLWSLQVLAESDWSANPDEGRLMDQEHARARAELSEEEWSVATEAAEEMDALAASDLIRALAAVRLAELRQPTAGQQ